MNGKFKLYVSILMFVFLLTACENNSFTLSGESENWRAEYEVKSMQENKGTINVTLEFLGEKAIPKKIEYKIGRFSGSTTSLQNNRVFNIGQGSCSGCPSKSKVITALIKWNGNNERITLESH